jgi:hypothetical protein
LIIREPHDCVATHAVGNRSAAYPDVGSADELTNYFLI